MRLVNIGIDGAFAVEGSPIADRRGHFAKPFTAEELQKAGISFAWSEIFWSRSQVGSIRGMHFQVPPHAAAKLVWCVLGTVNDVILDLRKGERTYGLARNVVLGEGGYLGVVIPEGCAHGFEVPRGEAITCYATSAPHSPECDLGIHWDSFGYVWSTRDPIVSQRDGALPNFDDFQSPF